MKILELKSSNIKRLKAVELQLDEKQNLIFITGKNGQGKTSVLDSIWYALGGTKIAPEKPIREGQEKAEIELNLGDYKVVRTFTEKGSYLKVENGEGAKYSNPQELLNKVIGQLSFDPLEFARMESKKQVATLVDLTGLDFGQLDEEQRKLSEDRQFAGRELRGMGHIAEETFKAAIETAKKPEVNITELAQQIQAGTKINNELENLDSEFTKNQSKLTQLLEDIKAIERQQETILARKKTLDNQRIDVPKLQTQLAEAEKVNSEIREAKQVLVEVEAQGKKQLEYDELTKKLEANSAARQEKLKTAQMPIQGLSWTEEGVLYNGIPFDQLSAAEQLKVSMAMAMASNPKLKIILIRDGSLLDKDNMAVIAELAKEFDFQIWIEKVDDSGKVGVYIEDGEVKSIEGNELPKTA